MNKVVKIVIICLVILIAVIGIILGINFISDSANKINEEYENDKKLLQVNYNNFSSYITEYNETRIELGILMEKAMYYEDFPKVSESLVTFYSAYDELINKIIISVKNMDKACKREYMENDYIDMCNSYGLTYEKMINIFISDIEAYNTLINNYNEWAKDDKYQLFTSKYITDYIDYNQDSIYEGMVEN